MSRTFVKGSSGDFLQGLVARVCLEASHASCPLFKVIYMFEPGVRASTLFSWSGGAPEIWKSINRESQLKPEVWLRDTEWIELGA